MTARRFTFLLGGRLGAAFIQRDGSISATVPVGDLCRFDLHKLTAAEAFGLADALNQAASAIVSAPAETGEAA